MGAKMSPTMPIKHIVVAHDFSEMADHALGYALDLAETLGARVTIVHAYEVPMYGYPEGPALTVEMAAQIERAALNGLENVAKRFRRPGVEVGTTLRHGPAWSEIDAA